MSGSGGGSPGAGIRVSPGAELHVGAVVGGVTYTGMGVFWMLFVVVLVSKFFGGFEALEVLAIPRK